MSDHLQAIKFLAGMYLTVERNGSALPVAGPRNPGICAPSGTQGVY
jgi:hypothetical protein